MGRAGIFKAKEVQNSNICWQCDGYSILRHRGRYFGGHFIQGKYNYWSILYKLVKERHLCGHHFRSDKEVVAAVEEWFHGKDFFTSGLLALKHSWSKCIALEENYIEKEEVDFDPK